MTRTLSADETEVVYGNLCDTWLALRDRPDDMAMAAKIVTEIELLGNSLRAGGPLPEGWAVEEENDFRHRTPEVLIEAGDRVQLNSPRYEGVYYGWVISVESDSALVGWDTGRQTEIDVDQLIVK